MTGDALDLDPADPQQAAACRRLWCAVLLAALADADGGDAQARAWFRSRDFRLVASLAGLDDDTALERITAMHAAGTAQPIPPAPRRDGRGAGKSQGGAERRPAAYLSTAKPQQTQKGGVK